MLTMTPKRRAWLEYLRDNGPASSHTIVGYACRQAGWTEWWVTLKDGRSMPLTALYAYFQDTPAALVWAEIADPISKECITDACRSALKEHGDE